MGRSSMGGDAEAIIGSSWRAQKLTVEFGGKADKAACLPHT
jgi:hypothetical protein